MEQVIDLGVRLAWQGPLGYVTILSHIVGGGALKVVPNVLGHVAYLDRLYVTVTNGGNAPFSLSKHTPLLSLIVESKPGETPLHICEEITAQMWHGWEFDEPKPLITAHGIRSFF